MCNCIGLQNTGLDFSYRTTVVATDLVNAHSYSKKLYKSS